MPRDHNFRYVYANAIQIGLSNHDLKVVFGISEEQGEAENTSDQVGVNMTLITAKILALILTKTIETHEQISGQEVPVDPAKMEVIQTIIDSAKATQASAPSG